MELIRNCQQLKFCKISCHLSVLLIFSFSSVLLHILFVNIFLNGSEKTLPAIRTFLFLIVFVVIVRQLKSLAVFLIIWRKMLVKCWFLVRCNT